MGQCHSAVTRCAGSLGVVRKGITSAEESIRAHATRREGRQEALGEREHRLTNRSAKREEYLDWVQRRSTRRHAANHVVNPLCGEEFASDKPLVNKSQFALAFLRTSWL